MVPEPKFTFMHKRSRICPAQRHTNILQRRNQLALTVWGRNQPIACFGTKCPLSPARTSLQYIFWFFANKICRWWDAKYRQLHYELVYSPGINATDSNAVAVHVVFHEFYLQVLPELSLQRTAVLHWPRLIHRRLYYQLIMQLEKKIYKNPRVSLAAVSSSGRATIEKTFRPSRCARNPQRCGRRSSVPLPALALRISAREQFNLSSEEFRLSPDRK